MAHSKLQRTKTGAIDGVWTLLSFSNHQKITEPNRTTLPSLENRHHPILASEKEFKKEDEQNFTFPTHWLL
ncbi:hypothetical protein BP6252_11702 [Coleophoma cylindrospora]|uniref:Uncharacterized protein n=1 Tax=Coleophoma cylindrospora TaxID=1849047 RepID=A0A3D8QKG7_9HELO|nr:hypothetical protein BP6252_11702 [Coleophoma cylindrospora]